MTNVEFSQAVATLGLNAEQMGRELGLSERSVYYRMAGEIRVKPLEAQKVNMMIAAKQVADAEISSKNGDKPS